MPEFMSLFIVKHPSNASREVALAEAREADKAIEALGLECVGGSYAKDGDAIGASLAHVFEGG